jgi:hypothetical protein
MRRRTSSALLDPAFTVPQVPPPPGRRRSLRPPKYLPRTGSRRASGDPGPPFSRPQKETVAGWIAGLVFGVVCIGAGLVVVIVIAIAVMGLALAVGHLTRRWICIVQPRVELAAR